MSPVPEYFFPVVSSTMDVARRIARGEVPNRGDRVSNSASDDPSESPVYPPGAPGRRIDRPAPDDPATPPELFRVRSDHQTAGRGRRGNRWFDRPGDAIMMTIALRRGSSHDPEDANPGTLALRAGAVLVATLTRRSTGTDRSGGTSGAMPFTGVPAAEAVPPGASVADVAVKWPNDILYRNRKVAGILVEGDSRWFYIGIGINAYPPDDSAAALYARVVTAGDAPLHESAPPDANARRSVVAPGTIREIPGCPVGRAFLDRFDDRFLHLIHGDRWYPLVSEHLAWVGRTVTVGDGASKISGTFRGIAPDGAALIETDSTRVSCYAGTMRLADPSR